MVTDLLQFAWHIPGVSPGSPVCQSPFNPGHMGMVGHSVRTSHSPSGADSPGGLTRLGYPASVPHPFCVLWSKLFNSPEP